jgi:cytochrome c553
MRTLLKTLKWAGVALVAALAVLFLAAVVLYFRGGARFNRLYDLQVADVPIPTDEAAIARGRHLAEAVTLCNACHGDDLGGTVIMDGPNIATIVASNLTSGRGGVGRTYADVDYVRAIRHGVNRDGRGLMIMHSDAYHRLGRDDLAAIVAYVKSVPPVDRENPPTRGAALGRVLLALGLFDMEAMPLFPAEVIDHAAPLAETPPPGVTPEYGQYLASIALCAMCHGSDFKGAPPIEEGAPPGPNIAVYGLDDPWSEDQFITAIRTGTTPYGRPLNPEAMPWQIYGRMTDDELRAIRRYLAMFGN